MGYVESFNELADWRDALNSTSEPHEIVRAIEERITSERERERRTILLHLLHETYLAQDRADAAAAIRGLDPVDQIDRWYADWRRKTPDLDITPTLEQRVRNESDPARLHALRVHLASEHERRGDYAAAEAVYLADIAANPDQPLPLIALAGQKLYQERMPDAAVPIIDRAVEVAMRTGIFRRHALATKARVALALGDHAAVEDVLRRIVRLSFTRGNIDIGVERDIFDRLPPGSIDPEVARAYDDYCRAHGRTRTHAQTHLDELVLWFTKPNWHKVARIVTQVLDECERQGVATEGNAVEGSIRFLVEEGRLEAQGDISQWRHSEIRRVDAAASNAGRPEERRPDPTAPTIAARRLTMTVEGRDVEVPVTVHAPLDRNDHWRCDFTIGWPKGPRRGQANGLDAVQALVSALHLIGRELYASDAHRAGALKWHEPGSGYGFPIHRTLRDASVGLDKLL